MPTVEIEYCVPCGLLDRAIQTQRSLLETYGRELDGVRLTTGANGVFTVSVDDRTVWDKAEADTGYDLGDIEEAVDEAVRQEAV